MAPWGTTSNLEGRHSMVESKGQQYISHWRPSQPPNCFLCQAGSWGGQSRHIWCQGGENNQDRNGEKWMRTETEKGRDDDNQKRTRAESCCLRNERQASRTMNKYASSSFPLQSMGLNLILLFPMSWFYCKIFIMALFMGESHKVMREWNCFIHRVLLKFIFLGSHSLEKFENPRSGEKSG